MNELNLTRELARLLNFTADVATAIRMYSAYNQGGHEHENAPLDLMWLSDCLHGFDRLGRAILEKNPTNIVSACDSLLTSYESYQVLNPIYGDRNAKPSFDRNANMFSLNEGIDIFTDIKAKVFHLLIEAAIHAQPTKILIGEGDEPLLKIVPLE